jgi:flagellar basal-body rod protein FlgB
MDYSHIKTKVISDNIANYNTPGYKASQVQFDSLFEKNTGLQLKTTNKNHITGSNSDQGVEIVQDVTSKERADGNNVDLNQEMLDMIKNNYLFNTSVQALNKDFSITKLAIGN